MIGSDEDKLKDLATETSFSKERQESCARDCSNVGSARTLRAHGQARVCETTELINMGISYSRDNSCPHSYEDYLLDSGGIFAGIWATEYRSTCSVQTESTAASAPTAGRYSA
jgi:hypothetical protein